MSGTECRTGLFVRLGLVPYQEAWDLQTRLVAARCTFELKQDVILSLEHPPVFTLGRRGKREHLKVSEAFLQTQGIGVLHIERGGDITYHGPGQLVIYPIVDLRKARLGVKDLIWGLEEVMIRAAADQGVGAERNNLNRGVWVGRRKLGSIGIAIRHGVSFHGMAFNVNTDLHPFSWVDPCGLSGIQMTSLKQELGKEVTMEGLRDAVASHMEGVFNAKIVETSQEDLLSILHSPEGEKTSASQA